MHTLKTDIKKTHIKETIFLSIPLILTQVGHIVTGMVDTYFLGKIGKTEQAACILSNNLYLLLLVFSIGMSYALTPSVTEAFVKQDDKEKASLFKNSLFVNVIVSVFLFLVLFFSSPLLAYMQQPEDVVKLAIPFFDVLIFSIIPVTLFFVCKQYTEGLSNTRAAMYISVIGNIINVILNYVLIYGKLGLPAMGYMGSCWASFIARLFMGIGFLVFVFNHKQINSFASHFKSVVISKKQSWILFKDGLASAFQFISEASAFVVAGLMAGVFGKEQIDAHGIALSMAAFTYMFASGLGSTTTIRVGNYLAQHDLGQVKQAIHQSFKLNLVIMGFMALVFISFNKFLPLIFSNDSEIILITSNLLLFAAAFQLFDGSQVVAVGALRGLEDYKYPTIIVMIGYWLVALPLCYVFAFSLHMEVYGVWLALSISLGLVAVFLFLRLQRVLKNKFLPS